MAKKDSKPNDQGAQERLDEIIKKIKPFVKPRIVKIYSTYGKWRLTSDLLFAELTHYPKGG